MRGLRRAEGQATIEYALVALIFFMMVLFVMDGGRILWNYITVAEAARVGARYAITHGATASDTVLRQQILSRTVGLDPASLTVTSTWTPSHRPGSRVTVSVTYTTQPVVGLFWRGLTFTLRSQSTMVVQN